MLALHTATGYEERGVSVTATVGGGQYEPGLNASLRPHWGAQGMGAQTLWQDQFQTYTQGAGRNDAGVEARGGYGLQMPRGRLLTPFGGYGQMGGSRRVQVGANLGLAGLFGGDLDSPLQVEFTAERYGRPGGAADHRLMLFGIVNLGARAAHQGLSRALLNFASGSSHCPLRGCPCCATSATMLSGGASAARLAESRSQASRNALPTYACSRSGRWPSTSCAAFLRPYVDARGYLQGGERWILALQQASPTTLKQLPLVLDRMASVRRFRSQSQRKDSSTTRSRCRSASRTPTPQRWSCSPRPSSTLAPPTRPPRWRTSTTRT